MFSYRSLPHWGRGTASAVDRVLSQAAHLRRSSSLSFIPLVPYPARSARHLPHAGKGDRAAVDRVLSQAAHLRRSFPLFFIPLEPYPARFARHLPHAGKALCRGYRFPHPTSAPFGAPPSIGRREPLPLEGVDERSEAGLASFFCGARVLSQMAYLRPSSSLSFIPLEPYPARSARHLPHAGKALCRGYRFPHPTSAPSGHLLP